MPILAFQAARRAIAADPHHPDGYFALYRVLSDPDLPLSESERTIGQVTALRQCLFRMPSPERFRKNSYLASPYLIAKTLAELYFGQKKQPGMPIVGLPLDQPAFQVLCVSPLSLGVMGVVEQNNRAVSVRWQEPRARTRAR